MTNKELQEWLKQFDDNLEIFTPFDGLDIKLSGEPDNEIWITPVQKLRRLQHLYYKDRKNKIIRTSGGYRYD